MYLRVSTTAALAGTIVLALSASSEAQKTCEDPPRSLAGFCNKMVGGRCDTNKGWWVLTSERQVAPKNDCVSRNRGKPPSQWR